MNAIPSRLRPCFQLCVALQEVRQLLGLLLLIMGATPCLAQVPDQPSWWAARGVVNGTGAMDYAAANQGQLKNFARAARDEMLHKGMIAPGHAIDQMVEGWLANASTARDYALVNAGQLKTVVKPFYDQLIYLQQLPSGGYPWQGASAPANDYAAVNLGQLKNVFAFPIGDPLTRNVLGGTAQFWTATVVNGLVTSGILAGKQSLAFQQNLTGGPYFYYYVYERVDFAAGTNVQFSNGLVVRGILAEDQMIRYGYYYGYYMAKCKGGTEVTFSTYYDYNYLSKGTLAEDWELYYNYGSNYKAKCKAGTEATFSNFYLSNGTLADAEDPELVYNSSYNSKAKCKGGTEVTFSSGYLSNGTLAGDWELLYNNHGNYKAKCAAGTEVTFTAYNGYYYLSKGTLAEDWELHYNYGDDYKAKCAAGTEAHFSSGYLTHGIIAEVPASQSLYYGPSRLVSVQGGQPVSFAFMIVGWNYIPYLTSEVTLAGDQELSYESSRTLKLKSGSKVTFAGTYVTGTVRLAADPPQQSGTYAWGFNVPLMADTDAVINSGYVESGTLAVESLLRYGETSYVNLAAGSAVEFRDGTYFIQKGILATSQLLTYGTEAGYQQGLFKAGTEIQVSSSSRVTSGVLAQDLTALYGPGRTVHLAAHLPVTFTTTSPAYVSTGSAYGVQPQQLHSGLDSEDRITVAIYSRLTFAGGYLSWASTPLDTDGDQMADGWEIATFGSLAQTGTADFDDDGLTNLFESLHGFNATKGDQNANGIPDAQEDADDDGLSNLQEAASLTNPNDADTDRDGLNDGAEVLVHTTNPLRADTDADLLVDGWEITHQFNPKSGTGIHGREGDPDGDGVPNLDEARRGTNPRSNDSDGDTLLDGWEIAHQLDPLSSAGSHGTAGDPDLDDLTNVQEQALGTHPRLFDTDGDGIRDSMDGLPLDPEWWDALPPVNPADVTAPVISLTSPPGAILIP